MTDAAKPNRHFIKPTSIMAVFHESGARLAPEGDDVIWSTWWQRRLNDGAIEFAQPPKAAAKVQKEPKKKD